MPRPLRTLLIPLALLSLLLAACTQPVPAARQAFVGHWESDSVSLRITAQGRVLYKRVKGTTTTSIDAPLKAFEGDNPVVGVGPLTTTFMVTSAPHETQGRWTMTVDGEELVRR